MFLEIEKNSRKRKKRTEISCACLKNASREYILNLHFKCTVKEKDVANTALVSVKC